MTLYRGLNMLETACENVYHSAMKRIERTEMAWGKNHPKLVSDLRNLSELFFVFGELEKAKALYWRILDIQQNSKVGLLNPDTAETLLMLGEIYAAEKNLEKAEQLLQAALGILLKNNIQGSELEIRILLKLNAVLTLSNQAEKILQVENRLYVFLQQYAAKAKAEAQDSGTPANPVSSTAVTVEVEKPRLRTVSTAA